MELLLTLILVLLLFSVLMFGIFNIFSCLKNQEVSRHNMIDNSFEDKPWRKFEKEIADLFKERWCEVVLWPWSNDNWKDIVIRRWLEVYLVQCKHYYWNRYVWPKQIRDFQWAIDLYEKQNNMIVRWIFVTSWKTTSNARETAKTLWIQLRDKWNWRDKIYNF